MRLAARTVTLALALATGSCTSTPVPTIIEPGQDFQLKIGSFAQTPDQALRIGFEAVKSDSRCPSKAQCFWAGEVVVLVWQQQDSGPKARRELHLARAAAHAAPTQARELVLVDLHPHPISGRTVLNEEYVATFRLTKAGETDR